MAIYTPREAEERERERERKEEKSIYTEIKYKHYNFYKHTVFVLLEHADRWFEDHPS
jgi:hypothetical protein